MDKLADGELLILRLKTDYLIATLLALWDGLSDCDFKLAFRGRMLFLGG